MKNWLFGLAVAAVVVAAGWWIKNRYFVTDETRIKRLVSAMAGAVEKCNMRQLDDTVAFDYTNDHGHDKTTLINAIRFLRLQYAEMFIYLADETIQIAPDGLTAQVTLMAKVLAKPRGGGGDTEFNADRVRLFLRKTDDGWKLTRTESPKLNFD